MADNFAQFYSGNMAPPDRMPDGTLKPSIATPQVSIADMYKGIYGPAPAPKPTVSAEGLNVRGVTTKDIVIGPNGFPVAQAAAPKAPANDVGYQSGYVKTNTDRLPQGTAPALAAIETAAPRRSNLFADAGYVAKFRPASSVMDQGGGIESVASMFDPNVGGADPWGDKLRGPNGRATTQAPGYAYGAAPRAAAPAVTKPVGLLETIASMFSPTATGPGSGAPGWSNPNITYSPSNMTSTAVDGSSQSFNPRSMQESSRWNSGY